MRITTLPPLLGIIDPVKSWLTQLVTRWNNADQGTEKWSTLATSGGLQTNETTMTGAVTLGTGNHIVLADTTSAAFTVTLPGAVLGIQFVIFNIGTQILTVATSNSQTINGGTSIFLPNKYYHVQVFSDGSNWYAI